jgi:hypothetical protein
MSCKIDVSIGHKDSNITINESDDKKSNNNINNNNTSHDHDETKSSYGPTTSKSFNFNIEVNPMHLKKMRSSNSTHPEIELVSTRERRFTSSYPNSQSQPNDQAMPPPEISRITQISQICQSGLLYIVFTALLGFVFILAQLTAYSVDNTITIHFWYNVDLVQLLFSIAILSAMVHVVLNANRTVPRCKLYALGCVICLWAVVVIVIGSVPASYQQIKNITTSTEPDRGSCHSIRKGNDEIPLLGSCFDPSATGDAYVRYNYGNSTGVDLDLKMKQAAAGIATLYEFGSSGFLLQSVGTSFSDTKFNGIFSPTCFSMAIDLMCSDMVKKCRHVDCALSPPTCLQKEQLAIVNQLVSCTKQYCENDRTSVGCITIDEVTIGKEFSLLVPKLLKNMGVLFPKSIDSFEYLLNRILYNLPLVLNFDQATTTNTSKITKNQESQECSDWSNIADDLNQPATTSNESSLTNFTCDPTKQTFKQTEINEILNSSVLLIVIGIYFIIIVMVFGQFRRNIITGKKSLHFHLSTVRIGSSLTGILMAALVYIGSIHLHKETSKDLFQINKEAQKIWRVVYLIVSFFTVYGSVLILVPSEDDEKEQEERTNVFNRNNLDEEQEEEEEEEEEDVHAHNDNEDNNDATPSESCCTGALDALQAFKAQFWDASGDFFYLKLIVMEILEITLQLTSLATSATSSHAGEVLLSSLLIAANFIVLPLIILIVPKLCKSNPNALMATVMVVEVLFDKLYVGIGVLLRYNTLVDTNMDFMAQAAVHGALLLPALMTALDIQDALDLSDHMDTLLEETALVKASSSTISTISKKIEQWTHNIIFITIEKIGLVLSIIVGLSFGIYVSYIVEYTNHECERRLGKIAACATEKYYFSDGLFNTTTCAFDRVETFKCTGDQALATSFEVLKDAEDEYANMWNLKSIDVFGSSLKSAPLGWAFVPNELSIDVSNSSNFSGLPFNLCSMQSNLTELNMKGTIASTRLDWTGQLLSTNVSNEIRYKSSHESGENCNITHPCGLCEADCDNDDECIGQLRCWQRSSDNVATEDKVGCSDFLKKTDYHQKNPNNICPSWDTDGTCIKVPDTLATERHTICEAGSYRITHTITKEYGKVTIKGHSQSALRHGLCTGKVDCHFTANNTKYLCTGKASRWGGHQAYGHDCLATSPETATKAHMWTPTGSTYGCYFGCSICQQDFVEHRPYNFKYYDYCYDPSFKQINQACTKELSSLSNFHTLLIGDSKLDNVDLAFENLGGAISKFTKLTHLDLQNNNLHTIDVDSLEKVYRPIVERYVDKDEVRNDNVSVSLGGNPLVLFKLNGLRPKYAKGWLAVLGNCTTINHIDVQICGWKENENDILFSMIPKWQGISYIDVDFGKIALAEEIPTFKGKDSHILSSVDIGTLLAQSLPRLTVVKLDLSNNYIGANGAIALAEALPTSKVTHIDLYFNNIGASGAIALAEALSTSKVTYINLDNNNIGDSGTIALAEALPTSKVTHINLCNNNIGASGAIALAEALPTSKVTYIYLRDNNIGDSGAISLAEALPTSKVTHINLQWNNIGEEGLNALKSVCRNYNSTSTVNTICSLHV